MLDLRRALYWSADTADQRPGRRVTAGETRPALESALLEQAIDLEGAQRDT